MRFKWKYFQFCKLRIDIARHCFAVNIFRNSHLGKASRANGAFCTTSTFIKQWRNSGLSRYVVINCSTIKGTMTSSYLQITNTKTITRWIYTFWRTTFKNKILIINYLMIYYPENNSSFILCCNFWPWGLYLLMWCKCISDRQT